MREGKESWIQLIAPDHNCCPDDGKTFCDIVRTLLERAPVRRKLVRQLAHSCLDAFRLMVIRGDDFFVRVRTQVLPIKLLYCDWFLECFKRVSNLKPIRQLPQKANLSCFQRNSNSFEIQLLMLFCCPLNYNLSYDHIYIIYLNAILLYCISCNLLTATKLKGRYINLDAILHYHLRVPLYLISFTTHP